MDELKRKELWPADIERLLGACRSARERLVILTLLETGLPSSVVGTLQAESVVFEESILRVGRARVAVSEQLLAALNEHFQTSNGLAIGVRQVQRVVKAVAVRAGLDGMVTPDSLRRTYPRPPEVRRASVLGQAAEAALDAILVADDKRRYVDLNHSATEILGLPRDEIIGRRIEDFFSEAVDEPVPVAWQQFAAAGEQTGICVLRSNGKKFVYRAKRNFLPGLHVSVLRPYSLPHGPANDS